MSDDGLSAETFHTRRHHAIRSAFWLAVTVAMIAALFVAVDRYTTSPPGAALAGLIVGMWVHEPFLKYGNHFISALLPGRASDGE